MSQIQSFSRLSAILTMDNTQFLRGTEVASKRLAAFSAKATTLGANITRSLGVGLALVGTAAVKTAADYNRATATLGAIVGKNTQAFNDLNEQSRELGRTSIFTATQVAEAQLEISKLGFEADQTKSVIKSATDIASIFGGSIEDTGKTIASTLRQFGLEADESGNVADIMAVAFRDSALDVSKFREAMKNVGPTAKATGLDLKKTTALLAVLANNAVDGSLGGTKLRSTLSDLAKQFPDAEAGLKKLENGTLSYAELVELLNKRAALVGAIFQDQGDAIEEMEKKLESAGGTTSALAKAIEGELFYNVERLNAAVKDVGISIGDALAPLIAELANSLEQFAESVKNTDPEIIRGIAEALLLIAKGGLLALIAGQLAGLANAVATFATVTVPNMTAAALGMNRAALTAASGVEVFSAVLKRIPFVFAFAGVASLIDKIVRAKNELHQLAELELKWSAQDLERSEIFKSLEKLSPESLAERLEKGAAELTRDYLAGVTPIKDEDLAERVIPKSVLAEIQARADELKEQGVQTFGRPLFEVAVNEYLAALRRGMEEAEEDDSIGTSVGKQLSKITFDNERFRQQLLKDIDKDIPRIFGQNFMFDELSLPDQLTALMNGQPIVTSAEFDASIASMHNEMEALEDEFEDIFDDEDESISKLADTFINIREGLQGATQVAQGFADVVGQAFLTAIDGAEGFGEALKNGFLSAFKAIIAKLITLITLYAILAVLSGGASMKGGGSFGAGVQQFTAGNNFGDFIKTGLSAGRSSSLGTSGGNRSLGINVGGGLMGGDIAFASASGSSANDRRFG